MDKYTKVRKTIEEIKKQNKNATRLKFKRWFNTEGAKYSKDFGKWGKYFDQGDLKCNDWDALIYHWQKTDEEKNNS